MGSNLVHGRRYASRRAAQRPTMLGAELGMRVDAHTSQRREVEALAHLPGDAIDGLPQHPSVGLEVGQGPTAA